MNGYISHLGRELGISTPVNDSLAQMVHFKAGLGRKARRSPRSLPPYLPAMRITERFGATYKPQGIKTRYKNRIRIPQDNADVAETDSALSDDSSGQKTGD